MKIAFIFTGQGTQFVGMCADLYERYQYVRDIFNDVEMLTGYTISKTCFNGPQSQLSKTNFCQIAIHVMNVACLEVFKREVKHIIPNFVAGLSLGELTALYASGVLDFKSSIKLIKKRSELMHEICENTDGKMICVLNGSISDINKICEKTDTEIANINSDKQVVISGMSNNINKSVAMLNNIGIKKIIPINVAGAYHSSFMKDVGLKLEKYIIDEKIIFNNANIPIVQNVIGKSVVDGQEIKNNIINQVSETVRWSESVKFMLREGVDTIIEFGPKKILTNLIKEINLNVKLFNLNSFDSINIINNNF